MTSARVFNRSEAFVARSQYSLMPLEFFVLFCAKIGFDTPYAILNNLGVSVGASSPTLKRLEKKKLLTSVAGPRNRVSYSITEEGEALLLLGLRAGPTAYGRLTARGLFESLPRLFFFSWGKGDLEEAKSVIRDASFELFLNGRRAKDSVKECMEILKRPFEGDYEENSRRHISAGYRLFEAFTESILIELQLESMPRLMELIAEIPQAHAIAFLTKGEILPSTKTNQVR